MEVVIVGRVNGCIIEKVVAAMPGGVVVIPEEFIKEGPNTVTITAPYDPRPPLPMMPKQYAPWGKKGRRERRYG